MNQNELEDYCLSNDFPNFMASKYLDGSIKIIIKMGNVSNIPKLKER